MKALKLLKSNYGKRYQKLGMRNAAVRHIIIVPKENSRTAAFLIPNFWYLFPIIWF